MTDADKSPELPNPATFISEDSRVRFAPADNLLDAIRHDVAAFGGIDLLPWNKAPLISTISMITLMAWRA